MSANFMDPRLPERFWNKVVPCPMSGCWLFVGGADPCGYGTYYHNQRSRKAHAVAYEVLVGEVPSGLELDHRCRTRCCCNPEHLRPVTHTENMRSSFNAIKENCKHGHSLADCIVYQGRRYCLHCCRRRTREHQRMRRQAAKAARAA